MGRTGTTRGFQENLRWLGRAHNRCVGIAVTSQTLGEEANREIKESSSHHKPPLPYSCGGNGHPAGILIAR